MARGILVGGGRAGVVPYGQSSLSAFRAWMAVVFLFFCRRQAGEWRSGGVWRGVRAALTGARQDLRAVCGESEADPSEICRASSGAELERMGAACGTRQRGQEKVKNRVIAGTSGRPSTRIPKRAQALDLASSSIHQHQHDCLPPPVSPISTAVVDEPHAAGCCPALAAAPPTARRQPAACRLAPTTQASPGPYMQRDNSAPRRRWLGSRLLAGGRLLPQSLFQRKKQSSGGGHARAMRLWERPLGTPICSPAQIQLVQALPCLNGQRQRASPPPSPHTHLTPASPAPAPAPALL